jgi:hypothetical protein
MVGTSEFTNFSMQTALKIMPAIQTCFLMPQITEYIEKLPKIVSGERLNMDQKSMKIHYGTLQEPPESPVLHLVTKNVPQWPPRTSKWTQNGAWGPSYRPKSDKNISNLSGLFSLHL